MIAHEILVRVARHAVGGAGDLLMTVGLGSCVAIVLNDATARVGGLAHVLLPEPVAGETVVNAHKFAETAVPRLIDEVCAAGAARRRLQARLVGGAAMFSGLLTPARSHIGERNLAVTRERLRRARITVTGQEVGGDWGRSVRFDVGNGRVRVSSLFRDDVVL